MGNVRHFQILAVVSIALITTVGLTTLVGACSSPVDPGAVVQPTEETPEPVDPSPPPATEATQSVVLTFDETTPGFATGPYAGGGIAADPTEGFLTAGPWRVVGMSDGDHQFGTEAQTGDFARGMTSGGVSTGGLYGVQIPDGTIALGVQATASDFAPGEIQLRVPLELDSVTSVAVAYTLYVYNDQNRSSSYSVHVSPDGTEWTPVEGMIQTGTEAEDTEPLWTAYELSGSMDVSSWQLESGNHIYVCVRVEDAAGSGGRDEFAIDDIQIVVSS